MNALTLKKHELTGPDDVLLKTHTGEVSLEYMKVHGFTTEPLHFEGNSPHLEKFMNALYECGREEMWKFTDHRYSMMFKVFGVGKVFDVIVPKEQIYIINCFADQSCSLLRSFTKAIYESL